MPSESVENPRRSADSWRSLGIKHFSALPYGMLAALAFAHLARSALRRFSPQCRHKVRSGAGLAFPHLGHMPRAIRSAVIRSYRRRPPARSLSGSLYGMFLPSAVVVLTKDVRPAKPGRVSPATAGQRYLPFTNKPVARSPICCMQHMGGCYLGSYVAAMTNPSFCNRRSSNRCNIISRTYKELRKAISPLFSFHGRIGPGSTMSQIAIALAFISRSISA